MKIVADDLKAQKILESTEKKILSAKISRQFPNASSKDEVEFEGKRYWLRFTPFAKSLTGKSVLLWTQEWVGITD